MSDITIQEIVAIGPKLQSAGEMVRNMHDGVPECFSRESWIEFQAKDMESIITRIQAETIEWCAAVARDERITKTEFLIKLSVKFNELTRPT